jgi:ABC-type lipoprotein export system ATPase subunit
MTEYVIELEQVGKSFQLGEQTVRALDGVTLRVAAGDYLAVMGQSGSGKSTLLNMLGPLDRPEDGTYNDVGVEPI